MPELVSFGVVLGKMTLIQLVPFGLLNVLGYAWNLWVCTYVIGAWDHTGGSCVNHIFGACFGMAACVPPPHRGAPPPHTPFLPSPLHYVYAIIFLLYRP